MNRTKLLVVFGTRPEAIKLFPVIRALQAEPGLDLRVCVTGQHRALLDQVLGMAGIRPDIDLDLMAPGQTLDELTARLLQGLGAVLSEVRPDRVIVQGDTASAMAASMAAYFRRIPVAHVEAGLRSGSLLHPWPEEGHRRIIGALADLHFVPTPSAAAALLEAGADPEGIHLTGNSGVDALLHVQELLQRGELAAPQVADLARRFAGRRIIAVTCHRREAIGLGIAAIATAIRDLARRSDVGIVLPVHPNPDISAPLRARLKGLANVALIDPLDYAEFVALLGACHFVLTDSGGIQEEAPALGKPVLVMRETTERPEGIEAGTARLVGTDAGRIVAEGTRLLDDPAAHAAMARAHSPFGDGQAATRVARILTSSGGGIPRDIPVTRVEPLA
ncbi:MAG: UDP-N-acetylglucosamine 2-epimerase (non-hydrolyzing) [Sphingobium sp.]|nr:UDP-N-acetylglucosamine 2-epimerase (non-hydrolyzing) [Sphingobium sp.]